MFSSLGKKKGITPKPFAGREEENTKATIGETAATNDDGFEAINKAQEAEDMSKKVRGKVDEAVANEVVANEAAMNTGSVAVLEKPEQQPAPESAPAVASETKEEVVVVSKSQRIRECLEKGMSISDTSKEVGVSYNFVYNVASRTMENLPTKQRNGESKSAKIRAMLDEGKTVTEIKKELGLDYNFVYGVKSSYDRQKAREAKEQEGK